MQKYAIILDGIVINSIEYELEPNHPIPGFDSACIAVQSEIAGPGYTYKNGLFTAPSPYPSWILENKILSISERCKSICYLLFANDGVNIVKTEGNYVFSSYIN
jgi:hypothetical protein